MFITKNKKYLLLGLVLFIFLGIQNAKASYHSVDSLDKIEPVTFSCVDYFYGDGCPHCAKVAPFIEELEQEYPDVNFIKHEIYFNNENRLLLEDYFNYFNVDSNRRGVPVIFTKNNYLIGDTSIIKNLREAVNKNIAEPCIQLNNINSNQNNLEDKLSSLSILVVIGAAIVDSINPCAITVLLILLGALLVTDNRKKILKFGLAFISSIYICYFLFGLGLFYTIQTFNLSFYLYKVIGILALLLGILNIKDYFWYGAGGFVMEIPKKWRPALYRVLNRITSPIGAFLVGFLVVLFELPCTGGPYLVILGLLAEKSTRMSAIPILLLYNFFFILPLLLITYLLYIGHTTINKMKDWKNRNVKLLHLIGGIIMLMLGFILLFNLV